MNVGLGDASTDSTATTDSGTSSDGSSSDQSSALATLPATSSSPTSVTVNNSPTAPSSGWSTGSLLLVAIGALLLGGVAVWMLAGTPELSTAKAKTAIRKSKKARRRKRAKE